MSEIPLSQVLSQDFEDRVDRGSWLRFTPSLAGFLEEVCRPTVRPGTQRPTAPAPVLTPSGASLLLTAPVPIVKAEELGQEARWSRLLSRVRRSSPARPSPDLPGVVLVGRGDGIEVSLPELDAQGRLLLGPTERDMLNRIGWQAAGHVFTRLLADCDKAAEMVTRILIEVLEVAHPADLDHLVQPHSCVS